MKIKLLIVAIFTYQSIFSQTSVPGGIVNGIWTLAGSPYNVQGSIQIVNGDSLIIQPGVTVSFQGTYKLLILGKLKAIGTITDTITFTAANTAAGWRGIRFDNTPSTNDTSRIMYCKIQYGNASGGTAPDQKGGGVYFNNFSKAVVSHSRIGNCTADGGGGGIYIETCNPSISNNSVSYNTCSFSQGGGGIYIKSGSPIINNNIISNNIVTLSGGNCGGGIYISQGNPTIINNAIINNSAKYGGGLYHDFGSPSIINNTISNNSSNNGAGIDCGDNAIINNNDISYNTASNNGGGINCRGGSIINNNTISYNTANSAGGGIELHTNASATITNNIICNNAALFSGSVFIGGGGIDCILAGSGTTIYNNVISNNTSNYGGGILCWDTEATFTNNTVCNNKALISGGALFFLTSDSSIPSFRNCVFWSNTADTSGPQVFLYDEPSDPSFFYCDIQGGSAAFELNGNFFTGTYQNNIDTNALFVSPSGGSGTGFNGIAADWSLQAGSPCIDTGDPNGTYSTIDIAGNPRVSGGRIDIGAYEFQVPAGIAGNKNSSTISIYPNPSSGKFTFQSTKENISKIEIYNLLGSTIYTQNVNHQTVNEIDLSGSPKGICFAKLYNQEKSFTKKIVIE